MQKFLSSLVQIIKMKLNEKALTGFYTSTSITESDNSFRQTFTKFFKTSECEMNVYPKQKFL